MKNYKKIISLVLGSAFILGSATIMANAQEKTDKLNIDTNKLGYTKVSDDNQNYFGTEEDFYNEMYNYCHGNNKSNSNYRNNMMQNNMMQNNMMRNNYGTSLNEDSNEAVQNF